MNYTEADCNPEQFMPSVFSYSEAVSHPLGVPQYMSFDVKMIITWLGLVLFSNFFLLSRYSSKRTPCMDVPFIFISRSVDPPHNHTVMMIQPVLQLTLCEVQNSVLHWFRFCNNVVLEINLYKWSFQAFGSVVGACSPPTKTWRRWHRKVNTNQKKYAICSAIAATGVPEVPLFVAPRPRRLSCSWGRTRPGLMLPRSTPPGAWKLANENRRHVQKLGPLVIYDQV